jgi:phospholipase/carboxylesterase
MVLETSCVIWLHGLGADASDMKGLTLQPPIANLKLHHLCLDAPIRPVTLNAGMKMRAWYDILGLQRFAQEDKQGILESEASIREVIYKQLDAGFLPSQIILAGFSQGGAMALYTALHTELPLGGIIALSSYLPLSLECKSHLPKNTPIFIASGQNDEIVVPSFTKHTEEWLTNTGYTDVTFCTYPMEHSICYKEIEDIAAWLSRHMRGAPSQ